MVTELYVLEATFMNNPYSLVFGIEPSEYISRLAQKDEIINGFKDDPRKLFMITGVRGSGKTVFMSEIKSCFEKEKDYIVIELSTERNMLEGLVAKLSGKDKLSSLFKSAEINLSFLGFGVELKGVDPEVDIEVALQKMLLVLKRHKKKLLVVVDEVVDNEYVREFASVFQILIRDNLPIGLLMTGLYENIDDLQNEKNLTFLHRAPKIHLGPLSIGTMAANYRKNLNVDTEISIKMAQMTRGFSYAFQVLGYVMWENKCDFEDGKIKLKQYLEEYVYDKIWSEVSEKDKKILYAIAKTPSGKIKDIRNILGIEPNAFTPYKKRLVRKGVIADEEGIAKLTLPLMDEFIIENYYL